MVNKTQYFGGREAKRVFRMLSCGCSAIVLAAAFAPSAMAQESASDDTDSDEIIVTAQKRSDNIRSIPFSVSAVGGDDIADLTTGGEDIRALAGRVPNLNVESTFGRVFPRFYIRGLGNSDFTLNSQASVAQYYDEVILENQLLRGMPAFDLERIEVLRGPQGTLWGRNATAGAVHLVSKKPGNTAEGHARLSYGRFGTTSVELAAGGPIVGEALSARVAVLYQRQGDSVRNVTTGGELGGYNDVAARGQLLWQPGASTDVLLQLSARSLDGTSTLFNGRQPGLPFEKREIALESDRNSDQKLNQYGVTLNVKHDFGGVELTSITSWQTGNLFSVGDIDGSPRAALINASHINDLDQITQELRLSSNSDGPLSWQAGFFLFDESIDYANTTANDTFQDADGNPGFGAYQIAHQTNRSYAVFGQAAYEVTPQLKLSGGLRYTWDRIKLNQDSAFFTPNRADPTAIPDFSLPFYAGSARGPFAVIQPRFVSAQQRSGKLTWDISANYEVSSEVNLYARVARGYHSGVIAGQAIFDALQTAGPETITSYEAGVKAEFLDRKVRFNLAGFHYDFQDQQLASFIRDGSGQDIIRLVNAPGGKGTGFEADIKVKPSPNFTFGAQVGYVDTRISATTLVDDPRVGFGLPRQQVDIKGQPFPFAPKWTAGLDAEATLPVSASGEFFVATDWSFRGSQNFTLTAFLQPEFKTGSWWEGALQAGYRTDNLELSVWGRNITNSTGFTSGLNVNGLAYVFNAPATYGVTASLKF